MLFNQSLHEEVARLTRKLQPNAILQQGPGPNAIRKGAGESATVRDPNWYLCPNVSACKCGEHGAEGTPNCPSLGGTGSFIPSEGIGCSVGDEMSREWFWTPDHDRHAAVKTVGMFWVRLPCTTTDRYNHVVLSVLISVA